MKPPAGRKWIRKNEGKRRPVGGNGTAAETAPGEREEKWEGRGPRRANERGLRARQKDGWKRGSETWWVKGRRPMEVRERGRGGRENDGKERACCKRWQNDIRRDRQKTRVMAEREAGGWRGTIFSIEGTGLSRCSASSVQLYKIQGAGGSRRVTYVYIQPLSIFLSVFLPLRCPIAPLFSIFQLPNCAPLALPGSPKCRFLSV